VNRLTSLSAPLRYRDFRYLWSAQVCSEVGDWSGRLALSLLVAERTHSAAATALVTSFSVLPYIGLGQVLSTIANRHPRRRTILITDLGRAVLFALMIAPVPIPVLFLLAFLAGVCTPPFEAARNSLTPLSVPNESYGDAIALASITFDTSVLFGYAVGGALVALVGTHGTLLINSLSFVVSALLLLRIPTVNAPNIPEGMTVTLQDGWRALIDEPYVRRFFLSFTVVGACAVAAESLVAVYGLDELGIGPTQTGLLAAAMPAGAILAVVFARSRGTDAAKLRRAADMVAVGSVTAMFMFAIGPAMPVILIGFAAVGLLNASRVPANEVAVLRIDDAVRIPAFSILDGFLLGSQALAAALGGLFAREVGLRPTLVAAMAIAVVAGATSIMKPPREPPRHARSFSSQQ
jgi:predicted MFS family arabinose efflux permease